MRKKYTNILFLTLVASLMTETQAAVIGVNWGGDMVQQSQNLDLGTAIDNGGTRTWNNAGQPKSPDSSVYTGQAFYGVLQNQTGSVPSNFVAAGVLQATNNDTLEIRGAAYDAQNPVARSVSGMIYFEKSNFLNGLASGPELTLSSSGPLSLNIQAFNGGGTGGSRIARMSILDNGVWYLSQTYVSTTGAFTIADPFAEKWAIWDPFEAPLDAAPFSAGSFTTLGSEFSNIQGVGFYFINSFAASSTVAQPVFRIDGFSAQFDAVPEPSMVLLLFASVGIIICFRKRRLLRAK